MTLGYLNQIQKTWIIDLCLLSTGFFISSASYTLRGGAKLFCNDKTKTVLSSA